MQIMVHAMSGKFMECLLWKVMELWRGRTPQQQGAYNTENQIKYSAAKERRYNNKAGST